MQQRSRLKPVFVRPLPPGFAAHFDAYEASARASTLVVIDPRGVILWLNPAWYEFAGEAPSQASHARYGDANGLVAQCSNCRKVRRADHSAWDWVPDWVKQSPGRTTHGICEVCVGFYWGALLPSQKTKPF